MTDKTDIEALREAALKATSLNLDTAQLVRDNSDKERDCPLCEGIRSTKARVAHKQF